MPSIKNIAIIAHVDHGKTTLVDKIMFHCELFRENENKGDLIFDKKNFRWRYRLRLCWAANVTFTFSKKN